MQLMETNEIDEVVEEENEEEEFDSAELGASQRQSKFTSGGNLSLLGEVLRKDPESYKDEFIEQFNYFQQTLRIVELQPNGEMHPNMANTLSDTANFIQSLAVHFPEEGRVFGDRLLQLLEQRASGLDRVVRMSFARAVVALANRRLLNPLSVLQLLFELAKCDDKALRKFIVASVLSMARRSSQRVKKTRRASKNAKPKPTAGGEEKEEIAAFGGQRSRAALQNYVLGKVRDERSICARIAQMVMVEAYRRGYWRDAKTANVLADDCVFHKVPRIKISSLKFFLGSAKDEEGVEGDSDSENEKGDDARSEGGKKATVREVAQALRYVKKTRKRVRGLEKTRKEAGQKRESKRKREKKDALYCNWEAINSLHDPQKFSDKLFAELESKRNEKFVTRLLQIALCARVIGVHQLQTLGFYSYIQRYLQPKQREVTKFLLYAAQAAHDHVPSDIITTLVRHIAQSFITDTSSPEAITVGLNAVREIFVKCPDAATEELLRELTNYKSYRNKNVVMAARGLINLFRETNPKLLHKKDRGRPPTNKKNNPEEEEKDEGSDDEEGEEEDDTDSEGEDSEDEEQSDNADGEDSDEAVVSRKEIDGLPRLNDIEHFHKRIKESKAERVARVVAGREGRDPYGKPKKKGSHVGRTNREMAKHKSFQMVKQKLRGKNRQRSLRTQQISLRNYLLRQSGRKAKASV